MIKFLSKNVKTGDFIKIMGNKIIKCNTLRKPHGRIIDVDRGGSGQLFVNLYPESGITDGKILVLTGNVDNEGVIG